MLAPTDTMAMVMDTDTDVQGTDMDADNVGVDRACAEHGERKHSRD